MTTAHVVSSTSAWTFVRSSIEESTARFVALLRTVEDGSSPAVGAWTAAETAAHVLVACEVDSFAAGGREPPREFADLADAFLGAGVRDVALLNQQTLERERERRPTVLADRIQNEVASLIAATCNADGEEQIAWLGGVTISRTAVLGHLLLELLVHGFDIAKTQRRPWPVPAAQARVIFDRFFVEFGAERFVTDSARGVGDVTCELRVDGSAPVLVAFAGGQLRVRDPRGVAVDVHLRADAAALLLVIFRRLNPLVPLLRGELRISGRRPWRLRRLVNVLQMP